MRAAPKQERELDTRAAYAGMRSSEAFYSIEIMGHVTAVEFIRTSSLHHVVLIESLPILNCVMHIIL